jgi:high-affinity iron transporter
MASFIITFREALEMALIVGIILSYLAKIKQTKFYAVVYTGIATAIIVSIGVALLFNLMAQGFTGRTEEIFEGITMLIGALLLTTMIFWMMKQRRIADQLQHTVAMELSKTHKFGLFLVVFVAILREGIEMVIFLGAASFASTQGGLVGALIGVLLAIAMGYLIFIGSLRINLKRFFGFTSILLVLFAAGLVAHGVHELQEAEIIPTLIEHVWDVNPAINVEGSYPLLHEKGYIGSILNGLFGYNGNPSLIEVLCYLLYLIVVFAIWRLGIMVSQHPKSPELSKNLAQSDHTVFNPTINRLYKGRR